MSRWFEIIDTGKVAELVHDADGWVNLAHKDWLQHRTFYFEHSHQADEVIEIHPGAVVTLPNFEPGSPDTVVVNGIVYKAVTS